MDVVEKNNALTGNYLVLDIENANVVKTYGYKKRDIKEDLFPQLNGDKALKEMIISFIHFGHIVSFQPDISRPMHDVLIRSDEKMLKINRNILLDSSIRERLEMYLLVQILQTIHSSDNQLIRIWVYDNMMEIRDDNSNILYKGYFRIHFGLLMNSIFDSLNLYPLDKVTVLYSQHYKRIASDVVFQYPGKKIIFSGDKIFIKKVVESFKDYQERLKMLEEENEQLQMVNLKK